MSRYDVMLAKLLEQLPDWVGQELLLEDALNSPKDSIRLSLALLCLLRLVQQKSLFNAVLTILDAKQFASKSSFELASGPACSTTFTDGAFEAENAIDLTELVSGELVFLIVIAFVLASVSRGLLEIVRVNE